VFVLHGVGLDSAFDAAQCYCESDGVLDTLLRLLASS
jgi:hypothetical protein